MFENGELDNEVLSYCELMIMSYKFEKLFEKDECCDIRVGNEIFVDVDYYNGWDGANEKALYKSLSQNAGKFILSTWHHDDFRENEYIASLWGEFNILTREHFYHVGARERNRYPMIEAIITNYDTSHFEHQEKERQ